MNYCAACHPAHLSPHHCAGCEVGDPDHDCPEESVNLRCRACGGVLDVLQRKGPVVELSCLACGKEDSILLEA